MRETHQRQRPHCLSERYQSRTEHCKALPFWIPVLSLVSRRPHHRVLAIYGPEDHVHHRMAEGPGLNVLLLQI
jgi:hypothetical protein